MSLRRFRTAGLALLAASLLAGCYYPPPEAYAPAPVANPGGTIAPPATGYPYYYPYYSYPAYYPYYYPPYYYYGPPIGVGVGFGFGFRGRFR